jgi:ABC-type multidrug transport system fused ATPase/permease subunit
MIRRRRARTSLWAQLQPLLGGRRLSVGLLASLSVVSGFTEAGILAVVAQVAASMVSGAEQVNTSIGPFHVQASVGDLLAIAAALAMLRLALQVPIAYLPARMAADVQAQLRTGLFGAFTRASWAAQSRDREGHLQEMMTSQVVQATQGALQLTVLITAAITFLVLIVSALMLNLLAALVVLAAALSLFALLRPLNALGHNRSRSLSQAQMDYAGGVGEAVRLAEETRVFGVGAAQRDSIGRLVAASHELFFRTQLLGRLIPSLYQSLLFLVIIGGLVALNAAGTGHFASLGAVVLLLVRAGTYGQQIQGSYQLVRQALPFVERLQEAERRYIESEPSGGEDQLGKIHTLAFEGVSYAYNPTRPVLSDVGFEISGGEAIGIIGPSGAGKSTLVQILLQLRTPATGRYLANGRPVEGFDQRDWHRQVAYVPQDLRLVHATVAENIRYYRDLDDASVEAAAKLARIHDEIISWPQGYETIVGPRADAVSGGQQQRLCLARALVSRPTVLVLDEPTSALDPRSEALLQESLRTLTGEVTLFIVAHRMSTLDVCDRVMVIVGGRLESFDSISVLERQSPYYRSATGSSPQSSAIDLR